MLELYQFRYSPFCLKIRMALQAKELSCRIIEVVPGVGQFNIFRLSGQRQVPILKDRDNVISGSSEIIEYLEEIKPEPQLIPSNPKEAAQVHLIENWADTTFSNAAKKALLKSATLNKDLRVALLPNEIPSSIKEFLGKLPCEAINEFGSLINYGEDSSLLKSLENLSNLVHEKEWLVGNSLSVADLAVAAQLSLIKFPTSSGEVISGKGCKGLADDPKLKNLFTWRDQLELYLLQNSSYMM
ncbi:glutathione S-transferase family protein [Prochlorococcus marinus]|uniref:glutathione S-transferase family protein n=1 Tax=Prochlorococcus marinus TaxID=1219 RepID=UPI0022B427E2|nr:glutathione S-transferase family protein [Prochlorococcus marinus]